MVEKGRVFTLICECDMRGTVDASMYVTEGYMDRYI